MRKAASRVCSMCARNTLLYSFFFSKSAFFFFSFVLSVCGCFRVLMVCACCGVCFVQKLFVCLNHRKLTTATPMSVEQVAEWLAIVQEGQAHVAARTTTRGKPTPEEIQAAKSLAIRRKALEVTLTPEARTQLRNEIKGKADQPKKHPNPLSAAKMKVAVDANVKALRVASNWLDLKNYLGEGSGRLTLAGAPSAVRLVTFKEMGVTHVITLQKVTEPQFKGVETGCLQNELGWVHISISGGRVDDPQDITNLQRLKEVMELLKCGSSVLVHCAAGMHRTGVVAYLLLRMAGATIEESLQGIYHMRRVTHEELTKRRKVAIERGIDWTGIPNLHMRAEAIFTELFEKK
eukprot:m.47778 g.47778  ORF g.47778 m.47778 type:complete len:348 (+) comp20568_c0_seq2:215-1258(+)